MGNRSISESLSDFSTDDILRTSIISTLELRHDPLQQSGGAFAEHAYLRVTVKVPGYSKVYTSEIHRYREGDQIDGENAVRGKLKKQLRDVNMPFVALLKLCKHVYDHYPFDGFKENCHWHANSIFDTYSQLRGKNVSSQTLLATHAVIQRIPIYYEHSSIFMEAIMNGFTTGYAI